MLPRYGEASLAEVLPSVLGVLGVTGEQNILQLPEAHSYCVLLVDGLGWNSLQAHPAQAPFLCSLQSRWITAPVPSTTATSLTTLGTGLPPGRHGVLGYTTRVFADGPALLNALKWDASVDPVQYQPHPTMFERAARDGVDVTVVGQRRFRDSGLTRAGLRAGSRFRGADSFGERVAAAARGVAGRNRSLVYVYDSDLDFTGHAAGCGSDAWRHQLAMVDRFAEEIYQALPAGSVLLVTGDHGMIDIAQADRLNLDDEPALRDGVTLVGGEARFRHIYTAEGAAHDVLAAWSERLGERAVVRLRDEAIADGWFGAAERRVHERIGDVVAAINGTCAVELRSVFPAEARLVGLHGALTADEMLVPLLVTTE